MREGPGTGTWCPSVCHGPPYVLTPSCTAAQHPPLAWDVEWLDAVLRMMTLRKCPSLTASGPGVLAVPGTMAILCAQAEWVLGITDRGWVPNGLGEGLTAGAWGAHASV